jgi:hypothetical protein
MIDFASLAGVPEAGVKSRAAYVTSMSLHVFEPCEYLDILLFNDVECAVEFPHRVMIDLLERRIYLGLFLP